jgi:hypothetical protein
MSRFRKRVTVRMRCSLEGRVNRLTSALLSQKSWNKLTRRGVLTGNREDADARRTPHAPGGLEPTRTPRPRTMGAAPRDGIRPDPARSHRFSLRGWSDERGGGRHRRGDPADRRPLAPSVRGPAARGPSRPAPPGDAAKNLRRPGRPRRPADPEDHPPGRDVLEHSRTGPALSPQPDRGDPDLARLCAAPSAGRGQPARHEPPSSATLARRGQLAVDALRNQGGSRRLASSLASRKEPWPASRSADAVIHCPGQANVRRYPRTPTRQRSAP